MFEKVFAFLLRLYPLRFREEYEHEAFQLIQDRLRDEQGFFKKTRLLWDLVADGLFGLPQAHRNAYMRTETQTLPLAAEEFPAFHVLEQEPLSRGSIALGGALSLLTIIAFGWLIALSLAHAPTPQWNGRMSPIEAVVERLNQGMPAETPSGRPVPAAAGKPSAASALPAARRVVGEGFAWRGSLTDAAGRPVRSAAIHLVGETGELVEHTAADGSFAFPNLIRGDYEIMIVCDGREVAYRKAHLSATSSPPRLALASNGRLLIVR